MTGYKKLQSKQQTKIDGMTEAEAKDKLKRLMGGGLGAARVQNELDELQEQDPDEIKDGYQLRFVGKDYARLQAGLATETVIVPNNEHNAKPENKNSKNLFITGDNLDALKHLENSYTGKVDVIYIDPPYNTGSDGFVYSDNFSFSDEDLQLKLGLTKDEVKRLRSLEGKSSHSAWLTFMYPRLLIAKRLLKDSGVIIISIDDNEQANLKLLCDEAIFSSDSFAGQMIWKNSSKNDQDYISIQHEYFLFYVKNKGQNKGSWVEQKEGLDQIYKKFDDLKKMHGQDWDKIHKAIQAWYKGFNESNPVYASKHYSWLDNKGVYFAADISGPNFGQYRYDVLHPTTNKTVKQPASGWRFPEKTMLDRIRNNLIHFGKDETTIPNNKVYLKDTEFQSLTSIKYKDGRVSSNELKALMGGAYFTNPKNVSMLVDIIKGVNQDSSIVVLDFFSGSGTAGHAVMQLNAEDGGKRQHIQVQLAERVKLGSEAERVGYKTIDEVARKRLELAAAKIRKEKGDELPDGWDGGYQHFTLAHASDTTLDKLEDFDPGAAFSKDMITPFAAESLDAVAASGDKPNIPVDGSASGTETLLATWLCDDGFGLTPDVTELDFADAKAHLVDSTLYIIDKAWSTASTKALLNAVGTNKLSLSTIILYPYSFGFTTLRELKDSLRTNLDTDHTIGVVERF